VDSPEDPIESSSVEENAEATELKSTALAPEPHSSIQEYYQLQKELLILTVLLTVVAFIPVWLVYSLNTALNYLIGACAGVVYLRMLAKGVEKLGRDKAKVGKNQLALFIGLIIVASQVDQLQIIPIFLGFLTYKAALIAYMFRSLSTG
jgi:ATP synthase protein I